MLGEKDLVFLGAALIWATTRNVRDLNDVGFAVRESKKLFDAVFNEDDKQKDLAKKIYSRLKE